MGATISAPAGPALSTASKKANSFSGAEDRRRRKRAKISAQVQVRSSHPARTFEEVCTSIDVSRDGLLFSSVKAAYQVGQVVEVTFPYSSAATALNKPEPAEIVRVAEQPGQRFAVALQFLTAKTGAYRSTDTSAGAGRNTAPIRRDNQPVVLAVEPDLRTAEIMRNILQQDGYKVSIVATANEALEFLKTTTPAVLVAEVEAKDMSGHDLCLIVKRNERLQRVPVILLTRSAQPADYSASHQLGAVVCMAKPFKPERLLHVVRLVAPPPVQKSAYASRVSSGSIERTF